MLNKLFAPFTIALTNRQLLAQLIKRDIGDKYKGTLLGLVWAFVNPLLMLAIYTIVFKFVFKARWPDTTDTTAEFALMLFIGLLIHGAAAEVISRAAASISANKNYVKKVVFPLHILSWSLVVSATTHFIFGLSILIVICLFWGKPIHATAFLLPLVMIPFLLFLLAFSWILSALSVYFKDITQIAPSLIMVLLFTSTVFFPLNNAPDIVQPILAFNPLTLIIESSREVLFYGRVPDTLALSLYFVFSFLACIFAYHFFSRLAKGFADTL